jgi:hypothetical protein
MITKELIEDAKAAGFALDPVSGAVFIPSNGRGSLDLSVLAKLADLQRQRERQAVAVPDKPVAWLVGLAYAFTDYGHAVAFAQTNMMSIQPLYLAPPADTVKQEANEPDMFWDNDNPEDSFQSCEGDMAAYFAEYVTWGTEQVFEVQRAISLANRKMRVKVSADGNDYEWDWVDDIPTAPDCPQPIVEELTKE